MWGHLWNPVPLQENQLAVIYNTCEKNTSMHWTLALDSSELHYSITVCQGLPDESHNCNKRLCCNCLNTLFHLCFSLCFSCTWPTRVTGWLCRAVSTFSSQFFQFHLEKLHFSFLIVFTDKLKHVILQGQAHERGYKMS